MENMQTYREELENMRVRLAAEHAKSAQVAKSAPPPVPPLEQQIADYLRTLPPAAKLRPLHLRELLPHLKGRYRDRPHGLHVGQALRRLGYTPVRSWNEHHGRGLRYWLAPGIDTLTRND